MLLGLSAVALAWGLPTRPYLKDDGLSRARFVATRDDRKSIIRGLRRREPLNGRSIALARVHVQQSRTACLRNTAVMWLAGFQTVSQAAFTTYLPLLSFLFGTVVLGMAADHVRQDATFRRWEQADSATGGAG